MKSKSPSVVVDTRQSAKARFRPIPLDSITFGEGFWKNRQQTIRNTSLKLQFEECEKTGRLENFRIDHLWNFMLDLPSYFRVSEKRNDKIIFLTKKE